MIRPSTTDLGRAIRRLRRRQHITIEDLAHAADIHRPTCRASSAATWIKLTNLAHGLDTPVSSLVRDAETEAQLSIRMDTARHELWLSGPFG